MYMRRVFQISSPTLRLCTSRRAPASALTARDPLDREGGTLVTIRLHPAARAPVVALAVALMKEPVEAARLLAGGLGRQGVQKVEPERRDPWRARLLLRAPPHIRWQGRAGRARAALHIVLGGWRQAGRGRAAAARLGQCPRAGRLRAVRTERGAAAARGLEGGGGRTRPRGVARQAALQGLGELHPARVDPALTPRHAAAEQPAHAAHALHAAEHRHAAARQPPQPARRAVGWRVERHVDAEQPQVRGGAPLPVVLVEQLPGVLVPAHDVDRAQPRRAVGEQHARTESAHEEGLV
eukprot:scaffold48599_cov61-Phaeocystis_antarctica.AAC.10